MRAVGGDQDGWRPDPRLRRTVLVAHHERMTTEARPAISWLSADGTMIELLFDAHERTTAFAVSRPDSAISVEPFFELPDGERLVPYAPGNNLLTTGCVLLPSNVGEFVDKGDLLDEVRAFLHRYVDLSPLFEEVAAHYVLLTWVHDAFGELPYLRFRGDYGTGKTRALLTVGSLCYKAFFASGASTVSPIFHILDAFQGTLILDEADFRFSDTTAELTKILNNGNARGMPVLRTMTNRHRELNPTAFRVFGPKIIGMREHFADKALESRFLTEETGGRTLRADIPIHLPPAFHTDALALRNKLLGFRFQTHASVSIDPARAIPGVEPRLNQTALALLSLIDDEPLRARMVSALIDEGTRRQGDRQEGIEAPLLRSVLGAFAEAQGPCASVNEIAIRFNSDMAAELGQPMSNKWVGAALRGRLRLKTIKTQGVYAVPREELERVRALAERAGINLEGGLSPTSPA